MQYYRKICAKHDWLHLQLKETWQYRDLVWLLTKRTFKVSYAQTVLGPLWLFLTPLFTSLVYFVVFGKIASLSTGGVPQLLFYLVGSSLWGYFASCVTQNANLFTANAHLFGKVYFPRLVVPVSNLLSCGIRFFIQCILVAAVLIYFIMTQAVSPNYAYWGLLIVVVVWLGVLGTAFGLLISSFTTKYRDLTVLVTFGVSLWMYASPVVYPLAQLSGGALKTLLEINPVTAPFELFRFALLGSGQLTLVSILSSVGFTVAAVILGVIVFNKVERNFMDTV